MELKRLNDKLHSYRENPRLFLKMLVGRSSAPWLFLAHEAGIRLRLATCPHCDSHTVSVEYRDGGAFIPQGKFVLKCERCHLVFTYPIPTTSYLDRYYNTEFNNLVSDLKRLEDERAYEHYSQGTCNRSRELAFITPYAKPPGRLLDIGCSWGFMAAQARDLGFEAHGTELSRGYSDFGRRHLGIDIRSGSIEECNWPDSFFDVLTLSHSFEHFSKPWESVRELARILKPQGVMLIIVPNYNSYLRRRLGTGWRWLNTSNHYYHFTQEVLNNVLASHFDILQWRSEEGHYEDKTISGFLEPAERSACYQAIEGSELIVIARKK